MPRKAHGRPRAFQGAHYSPSCDHFTAKNGSEQRCAERPTGALAHSRVLFSTRTRWRATEEERESRSLLKVTRANVEHQLITHCNRQLGVVLNICPKPPHTHSFPPPRRPRPPRGSPRPHTHTAFSRPADRDPPAGPPATPPGSPWEALGNLLGTLGGYLGSENAGGSGRAGAGHKGKGPLTTVLGGAWLKPRGECRGGSNNF